jgi:hypothetical protein
MKIEMTKYEGQLAGGCFLFDAPWRVIGDLATDHPLFCICLPKAHWSHIDEGLITYETVGPGIANVEALKRVKLP